MCLIADSLEGVENMDLQTQYQFALAPLRISQFEKKDAKKLAHLKTFT
jgi:hypothetical protein